MSEIHSSKLRSIPLGAMEAHLEDLPLQTAFATDNPEVNTWNANQQGLSESLAEAEEMA